MRNLQLALLTLLISLMTTGAFAHALWIETAGTGQAGKAQTVKIYYGEFVENERDSVAKWYSDVKEFSLWAVGPDGKKAQLQTKAGVNYYEATFTPGTNGVYTLAVSHKAKELGGTTLYHFLSSATVVVGKTATINTAAVNDLQLQPATVTAQVNKSISLKGYLKKAAAAKAKVSVFSPNGWAKELMTDGEGNISFTPPLAGRYVVEIQNMDKTGGQHHGKEFKDAWSGATYSFEVK